MNTLSARRTWAALLALALGGFAIGAMEFTIMGLLPNVAGDLLPELYRSSPESANAQAGWLISAYALGVVVGAPTIGALVSRFARKRLLIVLLVAFTVGTAASALLPSFELVLLARFAAGLPHGAYFGVASLVAASLMGPGKRGQGIAIVISGLTVSNVIGVPAITLLGQFAGWRSAYLVVAALFAATVIAVWLVVPHQPGDASATVRRELKVFARPQVWLALGIGAIGFGGFFAVYSYVAPMVTDVAGMDASVVPLALVALGLGMTVGNLIGGRVADWNIMRGLFAFFGAFALALLGLALTAHLPVGLLVFLFLAGTTAAALAPTIQTRLLDVAGESQTLAAAVNHASLNLGNSLGALLGGAAIVAGLGYIAPTWVGLALCGCGALLTGVSYALERRSLEGARRLRLQQDSILNRTLS